MNGNFGDYVSEAEICLERTSTANLRRFCGGIGRLRPLVHLFILEICTPFVYVEYTSQVTHGPRHCSSVAMDLIVEGQIQRQISSK